MQKISKTHDFPIQVTIITGLLGSGKTSFLSHLLTTRQMAHCAVIINEFGEIGLDHLLVEYTHEEIFALPNGCLCCGARGQLIDKMLNLANENSQGSVNFKRLIIETSGIADTSNLIQNLWNNSQIATRFRLSNIITLVSAHEWSSSRNIYNEADAQLAISDKIVISKSDMLASKTRDQELAHLISQVEMINATADYYISPLSPENLQEICSSGIKKFPEINRAKGIDHNTNSYNSCTLRHDLPVPINTIELLMEILLSRHGEDLLRVKGLVLTCENRNKPMLIQAVNTTLSPFSWLKQWSEIASTQITLIHRGKSNQIFHDLFDSLLNKPAIDQPDKAVLRENPLSIPGLGEFKF